MSKKHMLTLENLSIRHLSSHDRAQAYAIMASAQPHPWSEKTFNSCLTFPYAAVGIYEGLVLHGFYITLETDISNHKELTLMEIVIASQSQGQGLGGYLLAHLIQQAKTAKVAEIWLEVRASNAPAIHLYHKHGFTQIHVRKNYYPAIQSDTALLGREDGLVMRYHREFSPV